MDERREGVGIPPFAEYVAPFSRRLPLRRSRQLLPDPSAGEHTRSEIPGCLILHSLKNEIDLRFDLLIRGEMDMRTFGNALLGEGQQMTRQ